MSKRILILTLFALGIFANIFALDITGLTEIDTDTTINEDVHIYPAGVLQNKEGYHVDLTINGNLINEGTLQTNIVSHDLHLTLNGDLSNSNILSPKTTTISGTTAHNISASSPITSPAFYVTNTAGLIANGDIAFADCNIDFNDYILDLTGGYDISIDNCYLHNATIEGFADSSVINLTNSAYIGYLDLNNMIFTGTHDISHGNSIKGTSINNGIFKNYNASHPTITIEGDFTNNGTITFNIGYSLTIDCLGGSITNNGIWSNSSLNLKGTTVQNITCLNSKAFSVNTLDNFNPNPLIARSNLFFENVNIDLNDSSYIDLTAGYNITVDGGYLWRGTVKGLAGTSTIDLSNTAYLSNVNLYDFISSGILDISSTEVCFFGESVNNGIIQNPYQQHATLNIEGNITNNGLIRCHPDGWYLYIDCKGDITNSSTWESYYTQLVGNIDQNIHLINEAHIEGHWVSMWSEFATGDFQWYYEGAILDSPDWSNEEGQELYLTDTALDHTFAGTYYCITGEGQTRNIIVTSTVYETPNITSMTNNGTNIIINWDTIAAAISYEVYSSDDPYSHPITWTFEENVSTNSWSILAPVDNKQFYFVKAIY